MELATQNIVEVIQKFTHHIHVHICTRQHASEQSPHVQMHNKWTLGEIALKPNKNNHGGELGSTTKFAHVT